MIASRRVLPLVFWWCLLGPLPASAQTAADDLRPPAAPTTAPSHRPGVLPVLYGSLAGLQIADGVLTGVGVERGARELNPLMRHASARWAVKGAVTGYSIYAAERLWRDHPWRAVAVVAIANSLVAATALHNARVIRRQTASGRP